MVDFVTPMSKKDIPACVSLIQQLKIDFSHDAKAWAQPIASIMLGLEGNPDQPTLAAILGELPQIAHPLILEEIAKSSKVLKPGLQTLVVFILTRSPALSAQALTTILNELTDKDFLIFLEQLLPTAEQNHQAKKNLDVALLALCARLYANKTQDIHQWHTSNYSRLLVSALLSNPECVYQLSIGYNSLYTWGSWSDPNEALKHRIDALLNYQTLEESQLHQIALTWMNYFGKHPEKFYSFLTSVKNSAKNRTDIGNKNLLAIKEASWSLLKPGVKFSEDALTLLFYYPKANLFDPISYYLTQFDSFIDGPKINFDQLSTWFAGLPHDDKLFDSLFRKEIFNAPEACAQVFCQLAGNGLCTSPLVAFHQHVMNQTAAWRKQFLTICLKQLHTEKTPMTIAAVQVLNVVLLTTSSELDPATETDKDLGLIFLSLINSLHLKYQPFETKQFMEHYLNGMISQNENWKQVLLPAQAFTDSALRWLNTNELKLYEKDMLKHPLTSIVIQNPPQCFDRQLKTAPEFQVFLSALLVNTPNGLSKNQFIELFKLLNFTPRQKLARVFLQGSLNAVQQAAFAEMGQVLSVDELLSQLEKHPDSNSIHITQAIMNHRQGGHHLSAQQTDRYFAKMPTGDQLVALLTGPSKEEAKLSYVHKLFTQLRKNHSSLVQTLDQMNITRESLAVLANYTSDKEDKKTLDDVINSTPTFAKFLSDYLIQPTLKVELKPGSYLYQSVHKDLLTTADANLSAQVVKALPVDGVLEALKLQFQNAKQNKSLAHLFSPYASSQGVEEGLLLLSHWQKLKSNETQVLHLANTERFSNSLNAVLLDDNFSENEEAYSWTITTAFTSHLSANIEEDKLGVFINKIDRTHLPDVVKIFYESMTRQLTTLDKLYAMQPISSIQMLVKNLLNQDDSQLKQFLEDTESVCLIYLHDLIGLVYHSKTNHLTENEINSLFLTPLLTTQDALARVQSELETIPKLKDYVKHRTQYVTNQCFNYQLDSANDERLINLSQSAIHTLPPTATAICLNSYLPLITNTDYDSQHFLNVLNKLVDKPSYLEEIIKCLNPEILKRVVIKISKAPDKYSKLLEHLIHSDLIDFCVIQLNFELNSLLQLHTPEQSINSIAQLPNNRLEHLEAKTLNRVLCLQRLLFFAKPIDTMGSFLTIPQQADSKLLRRQFVADASIYLSLLSIEKTSKEPLTRSKEWFIRQSQPRLKDYAPVITRMIHESNLKYPMARFAWIACSSLLSPSQEDAQKMVSQEILAWLALLKPNELASAEGINQLIEYAYQKQFLLFLFQYLSEGHSDISNEHRIWLSEKCLSIGANDETLVKHIIKINSWSWLEKYMQSKTEGQFTLIKAALRNIDYLTSVKKDTKSQEAFLTIIKNSKSSIEEILELIHATLDTKVRSLLIIYLLSQKEYYQRLKGESILTRLKSTEPHQPSRLSGLANQLDLSILTPMLIKSLEPEAAISILFAVSLFPQLTEDLVDNLIGRYPQPEVVRYWVHHYALMPNAHLVLAHFIVLAESHVFPALSELDTAKRDKIIANLIDNLDIIKRLPKDMFVHSTETHLIQAMELYLKDHTQPIYVHYIQQLTEALLARKHSFSLQAMQLIITLCSRKEFAQLQNRTAILANQYIQTKGNAGEIDLFYDGKELHIPSMTQPAPLKPKAPTTPLANLSLLGAILPGQTATETVETKTLPEHAAVEDIIKQYKSIQSFDYFLIHYQGNMVNLSKILNDYLEYQASIKNTDFKKSLHNLTFLLGRKDIEPTKQQVIFEAFLKHPSLQDEETSNHLFHYNPQRYIETYGMKGGKLNYQRVIQICTWVLPKLDSKQQKMMFDLATQAKGEAELELTFEEETGFFSWLFRRLKRCWISGWTGFFSPNLPKYVRPASANITATETEPNVQPIAQPLPSKTILELLNDYKTKQSVNGLNLILDAIKSGSLQDIGKDELKTRLALYHFINQSSPDAKWVLQYKPHIDANAFRLLELLLENGPKDELLKLIGQAPSSLQAIIHELGVATPPLNQKPIEAPQKVQQGSALAETTKQLITTTYSMMPQSVISGINSATSVMSSWAAQLAKEVVAEEESSTEAPSVKSP